MSHRERRFKARTMAKEKTPKNPIETPFRSTETLPPYSSPHKEPFERSPDALKDLNIGATVQEGYFQTPGGTGLRIVQSMARSMDAYDQGSTGFSPGSDDERTIHGSQDSLRPTGISLKVDGVKKTVEEILEKEYMANGWHTVSDDHELLAHYALSQIVYRRCEGAKPEEKECVFDLPDEGDAVRVLWKDGKAIGFYTLRLKGTYVEQSQSVYDMVTLDTAYISSGYRRKGCGLSILEDIYKQHPQENIAFSTPIALPMLKVIEKFIKVYPEMKYKLWEITEAGCEGSKKLVWFNIARNARSSRGLRSKGRSL